MISTASPANSTRIVMDQPPLPPQPTTIVTATTSQLNYPDSVESSPRSCQVGKWDEPLPLIPGAKLRLMCSYGGHIIPRPHDKNLCYVGGDTRIVVVERNSSLSELHSRLSCTLLNGYRFTLKYQLPSEELDSLISVTTDEDLENMIEEYDRTMSGSPVKPSRLRLFLFLAKPETSVSMGVLLDDAKSETWFVDALNGADFLTRGVSDSAAVENLVELESMMKNDSCTNLEAQNESTDGNKQMVKIMDQEVHSTMPDSPMVETTSSFDSSLSSPCMANLPSIKVRVEDHTNPMLHEHIRGLEEQMSQISVASSIMASCMNSIADDERSEKPIPTGRRKPPLPLQPVIVQKKFTDPYGLPSPDSKLAGGYNQQSPDSVASDSSIASAASLSKHSMYQDPSPVINQESKFSAAATDLKNNLTNPSSQQVQFQQVYDPAALQSYQQTQQQQQQQFIHANTQYIQHPATGVVPISSYYPMYAAPSQQPLHQHIDQQYPVYYVSVPQTQPYNTALPSNVPDDTAMVSNQSNVQSSAAYMENIQPVYTTTLSNPETAADLYRTAAAPPAPTLVQVPSNQFQQQYVGLSQLPSAAQQPNTGGATANYAFNYPHPTHDQLNYMQYLPTPVPSQYQTMTPAAAVLMASQASTQMAADSTNPQIRTSQQQ